MGKRRPPAEGVARRLLALGRPLNATERRRYRWVIEELESRDHSLAFDDPTGARLDSDWQAILELLDPAHHHYRPPGTQPKHLLALTA